MEIKSENIENSNLKILNFFYCRIFNIEVRALFGSRSDFKRAGNPAELIIAMEEGKRTSLLFISNVR